jgi:hypothetical protein
MKSSNEVSLNLEVLEDRMALSGAFGGAIGAGAPSLTPFPFNGLTAQVTTPNQRETGFRNSFADFSYLSFVPAPSLQSQLQAFQNQMQAFQASQTAMIDQFFSQVDFILRSLHINNVVVS